MSVITSSADYWENRYKNNGNSGIGSYNHLAQFKADIINKFVEEHNINTVIELGCGDGNQLSYFNFNKYIGYDVSQTVVELCKNKFNNDNTKQFYLLNELDENNKADLVLSLDVLFHLLEDSVYYEYLEQLFNISNKYVIIYSSNYDAPTNRQMVYRKFTDYVNNHFKNWKLIKYIENKYKHEKKIAHSISDFYIYQKTN